MPVVSVGLHFLEISKGRRPLMVFVHRQISPKVVLNAEGGPKEHGDCRSTARNFTLSFESQQHFCSGA
jgi:hypothetical protein